jgi:hypothetical protein
MGRPLLVTLMSRSLRGALGLLISMVWMGIADLLLRRLLQYARSLDHTLGRIAWADWAARMDSPTESENRGTGKWLS